MESSGGDQALLFRGYSPTMEISQSKKFAIAFSNGTYDKVENKLFLFDEQVDCFVWKEYMFVRNVHQFQRIFRYFEELRQKASETIDTVLKQVPVNNSDEFREACTGQLQMMAKLAGIADKDYLKTLSMQRIVAIIKEFELDIEVVKIKGAKKLVFDNHPKKRWEILKLLDDDYLNSLMTESKYEVNSKVRL